MNERMLERLGWIVLSVLLLVAGCVVLYLAVVWRWVDCHAEAGSRCSSFSNYQIYASIGGLVAGAVALLESCDGVADHSCGSSPRWVSARARCAGSPM